MKKKLLLALLFSMVFVWILLSRVEWDQFSKITGRLDMTGLVIAFTVFMFSNYIRAIRFNQLDHTEKRVVHWWNITAFYNVVTATLPGGAGEAATAYVIKRFSDFNLLTSLRILLLSRLMDLFAMSLLFFVSALCISDGTPYREAGIWIAGTLFLLSSLAFLRLTEEVILKLIRRLPGMDSFKEKVYEKLLSLIEVSEEQRKNNTFKVTLLYSVVMMTVGSVSIHLLLRAFGIDFNLLQSVYCYGIYMI
ncbi:MAG: lysylphosphatidylglycerol synthase domain-containing protein, partial [Nitrospirota bacterium]